MLCKSLNFKMFLLHFLVGITLITFCQTMNLRKNDNGTKPEETDTYYPSQSWSDPFDWELLKVLSNDRKNVLVSPISLKITLALLYEGSGGITEREFQNVLQFPAKKILRANYKNLLDILQASERREYLLNMGTRIFLDSTISPQQQFEAKTNYYYRTDIERMNFAEPNNASQSINAWIEKLTNGKINQLVKPDDLTDTIMLIANAVYFKGTWRHQFPKNQTSYGKFYVSPDEMVTIPYMSTTDKFYYFESSDLDSKILRLPYRGKRYSMFIVLPNSKGGLPDLIKKISLRGLHQNLYYLDETVVEVRIPKFKFNYQNRFSEVLKDFGLREMFQNTASFPGIARGNSSILRRLVVSDIIQKSGIELDEEGSVVYAATDITIGNKFGDAENIFNASHPFLFFIEEQFNGTILFIGKVDNPLQMTAIPLPPRFGENSPSAVALSQTNPNSAPNFQPVYPQVNDGAESAKNRFNYFDLELLKIFSNSQSNVFISPASIKTTLAMVLEGAKGLSAQEIGHALRIDNINENVIRDILAKLLYDLNDKTGSTILEATNSIFVSNKNKILPKYQDNIVKYYKGETRSIDFADAQNAAYVINSWVTNATHGAIQELISPDSIRDDTNFVLANALYFKGKWKTPFELKSTKIKCFNTATRGCIDTPMMMVADSFNYNMIGNLHAHAIELPYQDMYSMLILLPTKGHNIMGLLNDLQHEKFPQIISELRSTDIILELPRFSMDFTVDLIDYLKPLNIREIFGPRANLSGIIANDNIKINNLIHKTRIEVDEQGTVAAAATGAVVIPLIGTTAQMISIDRPFLFFIYKKDTRNVIFEGILMEPTHQAQSTSTLRNSYKQFVPINNQQRNSLNYQQFSG